MISSEQLHLVHEALARVFDQYKDRGMRSIYLWGTSVRPDYEPGRSDVDAIAFVDREAEEGEVQHIRSWLALTYPSIPEFHINFLYLDEMNGAVPHSRVAQIMHPRYLLLDFPNWKHVCGTTYALSDFSRSPMSFQEAIDHNIEQILSGKLPRLLAGPMYDYEAPYICKSLLTICHFLHQERLGFHLLNRQEILSKTDEQTRPMVEWLLRTRKAGYPADQVRAYTDSIRTFLQNLR